MSIGGPRRPRETNVPLTRRQLLRQGSLLPPAAVLGRHGVLNSLAFITQSAAGAADRSRHGDIGNGSSFLVAGKPRFLAAGSMDYFRQPHTEWRDRILKAKRAGLNTIMTYVAWNQHEPEQGNYRFTGRADIASFLRTCAELDMLAYVRVGPFICDEFQMGGHPAWLLAQPGIDLRAHAPATEALVERWLVRLCAEIAPLQITRGGPVAFVQVENEYYYRERPDGLAYLQFLEDVLLRNGIDVPLTACGNGTELQLPSLFETINGYGRDTPANFRKTHPDQPLLISEHYTDWMDVWTWSQTDYPKRAQLEQISMDALSQRAMLSYFCFAGGTNFGFNGASTWKTDHSWVCTRYWAQGPLAEGGALTPNYFAAKTASLPVQQFESFFAHSEDTALPVRVEGPVTARALQSANGMFIFVAPLHPISADQRFVDDEERPQAMVEERPSRELEGTPGTLVLPGGERVALAAGSVRALLLPFAFTAAPGVVIDYANCTLLGKGGPPSKPVLLFWGEAGSAGHISVNGVPQTFTFPAVDPLPVTVGQTRVIALNSDLADRTWFADGRVLVGPAFVGDKAAGAELRHTCLVDEHTSHISVIEPDGRVHEHAVPASPPDGALPPSLVWQSSALNEPHSTDTGWREIGHPRSVEELGAYQGYCWYRAEVPAAAQPRSGLLFTAAADRAHVWVDGSYRGVYGRGRNAARDLLPVELTANAATVTLLLDNMGRSSEGSTMQRKGILGPVYAGAERLTLPAPQLLPASVPQKVDWRFNKFKADAGKDAQAFAAEWTLPARAGRQTFAALRNCPQYAWITLDGTPLHDHHGDNSLIDGFASSEWVLPASARPQQLKIVFYGTVPDVARSVHFYSFETAGELRRWSFRPWTIPASQIRKPEPNEPCWWQTGFERPALPPPLFLATEGLSKGQAYLNGEPMGRYWELGPQFSLYLPPDTMRDHNTLALLEEGGKDPSQTVLFRDPNVPTRTVLL